MLTVRQALAMEVFAGSCVVAGKDGLDREIRWAHPVDIPHASEWVRGGELLLTTFYGLRDDPEAQIHLCAELAEKGLAGMVVAIGGSLQVVAQELCKLLQRPVEIDDLSFSVLAAAGSETEIDDSRRTALREGR